MSDDKWTMRGAQESGNRPITDVRALKEYILECGFLPLFRNDVKGFSVEEHVPSASWWTDDALRDPWCWRMTLAEDDELAYGKFFGGNAGFVSKAWFPLFASFRRDGYDFDARADEGLSKSEDKRVMQLFEINPKPDTTFLRVQSELKGKFEPTLMRLMQQSYIIIEAFSQRINKSGQPYGWHRSVYTTPEAKWGYEYVTGAYTLGTHKAAAMILDKLRGTYPEGDFRRTMLLTDD